MPEISEIESLKIAYRRLQEENKKLLERISQAAEYIAMQSRNKELTTKEFTTLSVILSSLVD